MSFEYPRRQSYSSESNRPGDVELGRLSRAEAAESGSLLLRIRLPATRAGSIISVKVVDDAENKALPIEEPPSPSQFVEGTLQGWLTICGASLVAMCTFGNIQSFGVYQAYYTQTLLAGSSPSKISWIGSVQLCLQFTVGIFSGKLFDQGYSHSLMISGALLFLFSSFMLSLAKPHEFYQFLLAQGFDMGMGMGCMFLPALSIMSHYSRRRRAVAMGIVVASGSVGGVIYPIILNKIFPREGLGFPWAVRFIAFINIAFLVVANLIMKPRWPTRKRTPVDMSQIIHDPPYWVTIVGYVVSRLPILNAGAAVGRFMPNFLADKYGPLNVIIPSGIISSGMLWALLGVRSVAGVALFGLVYGFVSSAFLTLASPAVAAFTQSPTLDDIGLRIGISCFFIGLALG
ncbi:MFS general substrate transporter [Armillaria borealis]|uniref:MFS general substrate transporter n=1 Tax=Armillaria borealis TaxID=47425 RepID=A0AA39JKE9_9AGAR|nr:MFS general substrate transporter [Armillaria borealis]